MPPIKHCERVKIYNVTDVLIEKKRLKHKYKDILRTIRQGDDWEDSLDGLTYSFFNEVLKLEEGQVYIQIDGIETYWACRDDTDDLMIYDNVAKIELHDPYLTIYFTDGSKQEFKYDSEERCYEKLLQGSVIN